MKNWCPSCGRRSATHCLNVVCSNSSAKRCGSSNVSPSNYLETVSLGFRKFALISPCWTSQVQWDVSIVLQMQCINVLKTFSNAAVNFLLVNLNWPSSCKYIYLYWTTYQILHKGTLDLGSIWTIMIVGSHWISILESMSSRILWCVLYLCGGVTYHDKFVFSITFILTPL